MTYWTLDSTHPGNAVAAQNGDRNPIKKWAEDGSAFLVFPVNHPTMSGYNHPITRWDEFYKTFSYIGRFGDSVNIADFPDQLQQQSVTEYFGGVYSNGSGSDGSVSRRVVVCGSPGEVSNDKT